jgi:hypothetical protein
MTFLLPAKADILLDIMNNNYQNVFGIMNKDYEDVPDTTYEEYKNLREDHDLDNGEAYSWDNLYLCTYCYDTEVIIDPYGSNDEIWFGY